MKTIRQILLPLSVVSVSLLGAGAWDNDQIFNKWPLIVCMLIVTTYMALAWVYEQGWTNENN